MWITSVSYCIHAEKYLLGEVLDVKLQKENRYAWEQQTEYKEQHEDMGVARNQHSLIGFAPRDSCFTLSKRLVSLMEHLQRTREGRLMAARRPTFFLTLWVEKKPFPKSDKRERGVGPSESVQRLHRSVRLIMAGGRDGFSGFQAMGSHGDWPQLTVKPKYIQVHPTYRWARGVLVVWWFAWLTVDRQVIGLRL